MHETKPNMSTDPSDRRLPGGPEVVPQPFAPEIPGEGSDTPIDVIEGALEKLRRQEKDGGNREQNRKPTIH